MLLKSSLVAAALLATAEGHARLTVPAPRAYNYGGGVNAPAMTCTGPVFGSSSTSMRCHDQTAPGPITQVTAGKAVNMQWAMEAAHPGDCSVWLSYDTNVASPVNWIKIADFPGCLAPDGVTPPMGNVNVVIPANLPSCDHCVLRWEWYGVQQVSNVEFYNNCADIKIVGGNDSCPKPTKTTAISGIQHLLTNYHPDQVGKSGSTGCPFYNVYDPNVRPPLASRSRGPLVWTPEPCGTTIPTTSSPATTTASPNRCAGVNCGANGNCSPSTGKCVCISGYTGSVCQTPPPVTCNVNCPSLNRATCTSANVCGACLNGFTSTTTTGLCTISCPSNCATLNRNSCGTPGQCGTCKTGFVEPASNKRSDACVTFPTTTNAVYSVSSQWTGGFCADIKVTCNSPSDAVTFSVPSTAKVYNMWNINKGIQNGLRVSGSCPSWSSPKQIVNVGFCSTKNGDEMIVGSVSGFTTSSVRTASAGTTLTSAVLDVTINIGITATSADIDDAFIAASIGEISYSLGLVGEQIALDSFSVDAASGKVFLTYTATCDSPTDYTNALAYTAVNLAGFSVNPADVSVSPKFVAQSYDLSPLQDTTNVGGDSSSSLATPAVIGGAVGGTCLVAIVLGVMYYRKRSMREENKSISMV